MFYMLPKKEYNLYTQVGLFANCIDYQIVTDEYNLYTTNSKKAKASIASYEDLQVSVEL